MSKTLEELQAELDAESASSPPTQKPTAPPTAKLTTSPLEKSAAQSGAGGKRTGGNGGGRDSLSSSNGEKPPKSRRGFLDFALTCALLYGVYATTPVGAIAEIGVRMALGQKNSPSLFATFKGRETDVQIIAPDIKSGLLSSKTVPLSVAAASQATGVDPELLITLLSAHGSCETAGCTMTAPRHLEAVLENDLGETATIMQVAQGLSRAANKLDIGIKGIGGELAVEAVYVGVVPVRLAVEQARASRIPTPEDVEAHARFYSPGIRRGSLQSALAILALHRLRTLAWPAKGKWRISSPFGYRTHPVLKTKRFHNGTDLAVPTGTPLMAAHRGVVKRARRDSICGNYIKIQYGFGIESTYCHMNRLDVTTGARVNRKQEVGRSGSTGRVTGPHLHYILRVNGDPVDAEMYGASPSRKKPADGSDPLGKLDANGSVALDDDTNDATANKKSDKSKKGKKSKSKSKSKSNLKKKSTKTKDANKKNKEETKTEAETDGAKPNKSADDDGGPKAEKAPGETTRNAKRSDGGPAVETPNGDDAPEASPAMPVPAGEEGVPLEDVDVTNKTDVTNKADVTNKTGSESGAGDKGSATNATIKDGTGATKDPK